MKYYVDSKAEKGGNGSKDTPFCTIQQAADVAVAGDEVIVLPGTYREQVNPKNAGREGAPVVYRSLEPLGAVIKGSELIENWINVDGSMWTASVDDSVFGDYNPYTTLVKGDWFIASFIAHTGDLYLNGRSMYEVQDMEEVKSPKLNKASWEGEYSLYVWHAVHDENNKKTVFYANFGNKNPNQNTIEISVRKACFYPEAEHVDYITLSGFTVTQAASQWAPPTACQEGMIGPHWSKGWIIEDCDISESKCCGISLGKYRQQGNDNKWLYWKYKDGTQTERDCIMQAQNEGWSKDTIGSHTIRRCNIHHCGQTGIVGHLGGVFSVIEENHIHHINNKQNLAGAEIGGIKMHAAIDVVFRKNHIHHCTRGLWLDWQAQGTRVTENVFHHNTVPNIHGVKEEEFCGEMLSGIGEDIFIEVSHGPTLVDSNLLLSERSLKIAAQGIAVVHNFIAGSITAVGTGTDNGTTGIPSPRYTPYHVHHGTNVAGFMTILHGDMRFYNNIFIQQKVHPALRKMAEETALNPNGWDTNIIDAGTFVYNGYPDFKTWDRQFEGYCGMGSPASNRYYTALPVWSSGNVYLNGAKAWEGEKDALCPPGNAVFEVTEDGKFITNALDFVQPVTQKVTTELLGMAFESEQKFENPDGSPVEFCQELPGPVCLNCQL